LPINAYLPEDLSSLSTVIVVLVPSSNSAVNSPSIGNLNTNFNEDSLLIGLSSFIYVLYQKTLNSIK
jgi:hypothetical protein